MKIQFESISAEVPEIAGAPHPPAARAHAPSAAGNPYRFGSRPPLPYDPACAFLKRSKFAQAMIDIAAIGIGVLFASGMAIGIVASLFFLLFVRF